MSHVFLEHSVRRRLVLHVDINKTIIQVDSAGGRTVDDVLNSNVAANVFGRCEGGKWTAVFGPDDVGDRSGLITYDKYVDSIHVEPAGMLELPQSERARIWRDVTEKRKSMVRVFTHAGQAGEKYRHYVEKQRKVLEMAPKYFIVPSFFELVNTLSELEWPFILIFRTFGNEIKEVLREWRQFLFGEHVYKPRGPVLRHIRENHISEATGCIYRSKEQLFFCVGPDRAAVVGSPEATESLSSSDIFEQLSMMPFCKTVYQTNFALLHDQLLECAAGSNNVAGIVDYYPFWAQSAERRSGGKVFPVPLANSLSGSSPSSASQNSFFYVFFDDNIFIGEERSIVDLRDTLTGASITDAATELKYCVSVNSYKAIVDVNYFVDCLAEKIRLQLLED